MNVRVFNHRLLVAAGTLIALAAAPAVRAGDGDALAIVNGESISRQQVIDVLLDAHGIEILQQVLLVELCKQESKRLGLAVTRSDVQREFDNSVEKIAAATAGRGGDAPTEENKRRALQAILEQKGLSHAEFMLGMERNAHLRKIIEKDLQITEETLREQFRRTYGEQVQVRQIVVSESAEIAAVLEQLNKGVEFADVARRQSLHRASGDQGGLLPAFSFDDANVSPALRELAFQMKPGEVSAPIRIDNLYHLIKLEQRIAPASVTFEEKRAEVEQRLRDRVTAQEMSRLANDLFQRAKIRVLEPRLKDKFEDLRRSVAAEAAKP
ncbi:MAG: peptidylprolyl isomerase [Phycisphaerae bacterium]